MGDTEKDTSLKEMRSLVSNRKVISQLSWQHVSQGTQIPADWTVRMNGRVAEAFTQGASSTWWGPGTQDEKKSMRDFAGTSRPPNDKIRRMGQS